MKTRFLYLTILLMTTIFLTNNCVKEDKIYYRNTNSDIYFIPSNPSPNDTVKIVDEICSYDLLRTVQINGKKIKYIRDFNSELMIPCHFEMDTVTIGQLNEGDYTLIYLLIDHSRYVTDTIGETDTVYFSVHSDEQETD